MLKNILFQLLILTTPLYLFSMQENENAIYTVFFTTCTDGNLSKIRTIIRANKTIDINKQNNEGRTGLLLAYLNKKPQIISYLLQHGANMTIRDNYNQSFFTEIVYSHLMGNYDFKKHFPLFSLDAINTECKNMPLFSNLPKKIDRHIKDVLNNTKDIDSINHNKHTALYIACVQKKIPIIIELIKRNANLHKKCSCNDKSPYDILEQERSLFVIREAFNNSVTLPQLVNRPNNISAQTLVPDVIEKIKTLYIAIIFSTPEARIWEPVCIYACQLAKINETDQNRCLTRIIMLPQHKKTEINLMLLKKYK